MLELTLVDTHCHLDFPQFDADRDEVLGRARAAGVGRIVVPGTDLESSRRAVALADAHADVYAAVGIHPNDSGGFGAAQLAELRRLAAHPKVVAIGEIGIDLHWRKVSLTAQAAAFRAQIGLANELVRPVIIHDREAHEEVMEVLLSERPSAGAVLHAFSGDRAMAEAAVAAGYYLGVDGPLTYKKSDALREVFAAAPLDHIMIETDAPYLTPQAHRGQRNEPGYVRYVAEKLAEIREMTAAEAARATSRNAARFFRWDPGTNDAIDAARDTTADALRS